MCSSLLTLTLCIGRAVFFLLTADNVAHQTQQGFCFSDCVHNFRLSGSSFAVAVAWRWASPRNLPRPLFHGTANSRAWKPSFIFKSRSCTVEAGEVGWSLAGHHGSHKEGSCQSQGMSLPQLSTCKTNRCQKWNVTSVLKPVQCSAASYRNNLLIAMTLRKMCFWAQKDSRITHPYSLSADFAAQTKQTESCIDLFTTYFPLLSFLWVRPSMWREPWICRRLAAF